MQLQSQSSRELRNALQTAAQCISNRNSMSILDNVLLTRNADGKFYFTAATEDSQLTIPAPLTLLSGKFDTPVAVSANSVASYLGTLPECAVNFTLDNGNMLIEYCAGSEDKTKTGKVALPYLDGKDFPLISPAGNNEKTTIVLPNSLFMTAVKQAQTFAANDELRPVMNTLCIDIAEDVSECYLVSTDGHSLVKFTHTNNPATGGSDFYRNGKPTKILINRSFFKTLFAFQNCDEVEITSDNNIIRVQSGDIVFLCKAMEGRYPNYNTVIPKTSPSFLVVNKKEFLAAIKRVMLFGSDSSNLVSIRKDGMFVTVKAEDIEYSTSANDQVFIADSQCNEGFTIGFNALTLTNAVSAIENEDIRISLSDPSRAAVLTADEPSPRILTLVMPMLINE